MSKTSASCHEDGEQFVVSSASHDETVGVEIQTSWLIETGRQTPINHLSIEALEDVRDFAISNRLMHELEILRKAAAIVQDQTPLQHVPNITEKETLALRHETERKWRQPKMLYFTILVCSLGAIVQGWSQTSANGANLTFPQALGIGSNSPRDTLIVGLINSGPYLSVGLLGAWLSEPINAVWGRRGAVFIGSVICLISTIGSSLSQSWPQLLAFRLVLGLGLGTNASTVSVYAAECAPAIIRGGLAVSWQMCTAFGIFLGFVANAAVYKYGSNAWRLQLVSPFIPSVPLIILVYLCPESPAWYIKNGGHYDRAFQSLSSLRNTELQAAKELYFSYIQQRVKGQDHDRATSFAGKILELFTIPRNRHATMASCVVMLSQQLCGINIIAFYSSTIFSDAGFSPFGSLLASCVFGFVNFVGAFPAVWTMDTLGRRSLLLITLPPMALTMFAAGLSFNIPSDHPAHFGLLTTLVYLFCAEYSPGMGPVPFAYSAEIFPLSHREVGMSLAVAATNCWAAVLSLTFPRLLTALRPQGAFGLYAGLNLLAFVLIFFLVPETRLKTLDQLDDVFTVPTGRFIKYQAIDVLPWAVQCYLLRAKRAELRPLVRHGGYQELVQDEHGQDTATSPE